ncbi:urease accessory protein UreH [Leptolyngbyaceae cyanobacterium JSC-12]|nr:urease accessory protein UreH [Leptolyngbyaceae cyanobacterium JSC-12]
MDISYPTPNLQSSSWQGKLTLSYGFVDKETRILKSQVQAPLKVQRPFYPEGSEICHSVILHTAGGVVGGDRLFLNLELQPQAHALITTAAAGKIYRSNGLEAQQIVTVKVAPNACLEWLPQETIVFAQAQYRQQMQIDLAPGALWIGWEITRFGRTARGEKFFAGEWRSRTEVWQQGRPLWIDRQWLPGNEETFSSPHGLANCPVVGSFAVIGQTVNPDLIEKIRATWNGAVGQTGITRLQSGILCRYRGHSTSEARRWFIQVWQLLRLALLSRAICISRVWQ